MPFDARQEISSPSAEQRVAELVPRHPCRCRRRLGSSALPAPAGGAQARRRRSRRPPKALARNMQPEKGGYPIADRLTKKTSKKAKKLVATRLSGCSTAETPQCWRPLGCLDVFPAAFVPAACTTKSLRWHITMGGEKLAEVWIVHSDMPHLLRRRHHQLVNTRTGRARGMSWVLDLRW